MKIDQTDLNLFLFFLENGSLTHTVVDAVKDLFSPKNRDEMIKKTSMLTYRLKRWVKDGMFGVHNEKGVNKYTINIDNILYDDSSIIVGDATIQMGRAIVFEMKDNNYIVCFLEQKNV